MNRESLAAAIKQALYDRIPGHAVTPASPRGEWLHIGQIRFNPDVLCADIADDLIESGVLDPSPTQKEQP